MSECMSQNSPRILFGMGCFWGAEKMFWDLDCVKVTGVGYAAGHTPNPTYEEVCTDKTGHAEAIQVEFDPAEISYSDLVKVFFENHNPIDIPPLVERNGFDPLSFLNT